MLTPYDSWKGNARRATTPSTGKPPPPAGWRGDAATLHPSPNIQPPGPSRRWSLIDFYLDPLVMVLLGALYQLHPAGMYRRWSMKLWSCQIVLQHPVAGSYVARGRSGFPVSCWVSLSVFSTDLTVMIIPPWVGNGLFTCSMVRRRWHRKREPRSEFRMWLLLLRSS